MIINPFRKKPDYIFWEEKQIGMLNVLNPTRELLVGHFYIKTCLVHIITDYYPLFCGTHVYFSEEKIEIVSLKARILLSPPPPLQKKTIEDKISVPNSNANKRNHFSDDWLFWKQLSSLRYYSLYVFCISIVKLKKICEFHILAPKGLCWQAFLYLCSVLQLK